MVHTAAIYVYGSKKKNRPGGDPPAGEPSGRPGAPSRRRRGCSPSPATPAPAPRRWRPGLGGGGNAYLAPAVIKFGGGGGGWGYLHFSWRPLAPNPNNTYVFISHHVAIPIL